MLEILLTSRQMQRPIQDETKRTTDRDTWRGILDKNELDRTIRCLISHLPVYCLTVPGMLLCRTR